MQYQCSINQGKHVCCQQRVNVNETRRLEIKSTGDYGYGKAFPNHMELIKKKCDLVKKMHMENEAKFDQLADKVKCILLSAHNSVPDVSPVKVLATQPGKTNEVCYEAMFTKNQIYDFIMGKTDVVGVMDLNHGMKSYLSQDVLGSSVKHVGEIMLDQDINVLKLCSHKTITKLLDTKHENLLVEKSAAVLCKQMINSFVVKRKRGKENTLKLKNFREEQEQEELLQQLLISNENKIKKNSCSNRYPKIIEKIPLIEKLEKDQHDHLYPKSVRWQN
eukprot:4103255-Ditylum_brightwellii.AAC.1